MKAKKKIKEYLTLGMRKLKHRKGYGVHSPFAFSIITEVIEEKTPYYAYQRMQRTLVRGARTPISLKVATLIFRLANRLRVRRVLELPCDGGYTLMPLLLVDSRMRADSVADAAARTHVATHFGWLDSRIAAQVTWLDAIGDVAPEAVYDMIVVKELPPGTDPAAMAGWLLAHSHQNTAYLVKGIQPRHRLELLWDALCDSDDVAITMDLYDYGLAIRRPRFFKQHYVVSF